MKTIEQLGVAEGEWRVGDAFPFGEDHVVFSKCRFRPERTRIIAEGNKHFAESKADAKLISAVKELYDVVYRVVKAHETACDAVMGKGSMDDVEDYGDIIDDAIKAINKAGGQHDL